MSPYQHLISQREAHLAVITLNRPQRRNALSLDLMQELIRCLDEIAESPEIRAVILAAAGKVFCSGHDLSEMIGRNINEYRHIFDVCTRLMEKIQSIPQPVLAEIAYGIERLPRSRRRRDLEARFELVSSEIPRADWTDAVSRTFGRIKAALERRGTRVEDFDAAIAAHALALDATLVTANLGHMIRIPGLRVENWSV